LRDGRHRRIPVREEVRYALVGLLASEPDGIHAYEVDRRLRVLSEGFWTPYSGEISRTLHQLEQDADVSSRWQVDDGRPKRIFVAARLGLQRVDAWLRAEITADPPPLHDQLWYRFVAHRARRHDHADMVRDLRIRRATSLEELRRLEGRLAAIGGANSDAAFIRVALRMRQFEWQAEIGVIEEIERELVKEHGRAAMEEELTGVIDRSNERGDGADDRAHTQGRVSGRRAT
jgi:DNA-binding PadR family transcriptional regulator